MSTKLQVADETRNATKVNFVPWGRGSPVIMIHGLAASPIADQCIGCKLNVRMVILVVWGERD